MRRTNMVQFGCAHRLWSAWWPNGDLMVDRVSTFREMFHQILEALA